MAYDVGLSVSAPQHAAVNQQVPVNSSAQTDGRTSHVFSGRTHLAHKKAPHCRIFRSETHVFFDNMASASACPHYKDEICEVLDSAGKSGEFSSSGLADLCLPGLVIDEIGIIALPLLEVQAKNIIAVCSKQNNHDHKREQDKTENPQLDIRMDGIDENDKSLNDRNNRNCWQLESSKIKLENLVWHVKVEELVSKTLMELGFHDLENAYHQLDRMLLFERGGHLAPSRNHETDKINGLFAKLVILLPSDYSGGQLIVSHARKQNKYDFVAEESNYNFNYAAFYSDCKYEVSI